MSSSYEEELQTISTSRTASSGVADATPSSPATVVVGGGFKTDTSKRSGAEQKSARLAGKLKEGLVRKNKLMRKADLKKWSAALLRFAERSLEGGLDELEPVLLWYADNVAAHDKMPEAYSAETFCKKWDQIRSAYDKRDTPRTPNKPQAAPLPEELSEDEKLILKLLDPVEWPKGAKRHVKDAARKSYAFYRPLYRAIQKYRDNNPAFANGRCNSTVGFASAFLNMLPRPEDFVINYYTSYSESVAEWKDWSGRLPVASLTDRKFLDMVYEFAEEWTGDPKAWDDLLEKVTPYMEG